MARREFPHQPARDHGGKDDADKPENENVDVQDGNTEQLIVAAEDSQIGRHEQKQPRQRQYPCEIAVSSARRHGSYLPPDVIRRGASSRRATRVTRSWLENGLVTKSSTPRSVMRRRSASCPLAVRTMTGSVFSAMLCRISARISKPFAVGSMMSRISRSGRERVIAGRTAAPSPTAVTWWPSRDSKKVSDSTI